MPPPSQAQLQVDIGRDAAAALHADMDGLQATLGHGHARLAEFTHAQQHRLSEELRSRERRLAAMQAKLDSS